MTERDTPAPEADVNYHEPIAAYRQKRVPPKNISGRVLEKLEEQKIAADPAHYWKGRKGSPSTFKTTSNRQQAHLEHSSDSKCRYRPASRVRRLEDGALLEELGGLENAGKHDVRFIKGRAGQQVKHQDYGHRVSRPKAIPLPYRKKRSTPAAGS